MNQAERNLTIHTISRGLCLRYVQGLQEKIDRALIDPLKIPSVHASYTGLADKIAQFEQNHIAIMAHESNNDQQEQLYLEYDEFQNLVTSIQSSYLSPPFTMPATNVSNHEQSGNASQTESLAHTAQTSFARLPRLDLPKFTGAISEWSSYFDIFNAAVHNNVHLQAVQKFQYLKSTLQGEPLSLIRNLPLTEGNYIEALNLLRDRYAKKRLISSYHLQSLVGLPKPIPLNFNSAISFLNATKEHVAALKAAGEPVDSWSRVLTFILINKLDPQSRSEFERNLSQENLPDLDQLYRFLESVVSSYQWQTVCTSPTKPSPTQEKAHSRRSSPKSHKSRFLSFTTTANNISCPLCKSSHVLTACDKFKSMLPKDRLNAVHQCKVCINCLSSQHQLSQCNSRYRCRKCNKLHHSLLHFNDVRTPAHQSRFSAHAQPSTSSSDDVTPSTSLVAPISTLHSTTPSSHSSVILATALIRVADKHRQWVTVRALLDSGSEASYITSNCFNRLGLYMQPSATTVSGFSNACSIKVDGSARLSIRPYDRSEPNYFLDTLVVPKITCDLPKQPLPDYVLPYFQHLPLADPTFSSPAPIDVLIGADLYFHLLTGRKLRHPGLPMAVHTTLGWIISGRVLHHGSKPSAPLCSLHTSIDDNLDRSISKFWEVEEMPPIKFSSPDEVQAETIFTSNVQRDNTGRYIVPLLFRSFPPSIGFSYSTALKCYQSLRHRLLNNEPLRNSYSEFMQEYSDLGHMSPIHNDDVCTGFYLPHHGVLRNSNGISKLRVVFNGSQPSSNSNSLNSEMLPGPALQTEILTVVTRARRHKYIFTADIRHMYRQILVQSDHRIFQKILWSPTLNYNPSTYLLNTVTYGTSCAPFLALRTLRQLAQDGRSAFPEAAQVLLDEVFVDDIITGADTLTDALDIRDQLVNLLASASLELRKWTANDPRILSGIPADHHEQSFLHSIDSGESIKILGLVWNPTSDAFSYRINLPSSATTKRQLLSHISQIFDPLGWLTPAIFLAKHLIQEVWKLHLNWDDPLPASILAQWDEIRTQLSSLSSVTIPRHIYSSSSTGELHGFCDASQNGYACCVYFRPNDPSLPTVISLLAGKSRVAPLKTVSLPRLELCGALLLSRLMAHLLQSCGLLVTSTYAWSDSRVALAWISSQPYRWKTFVSNRVAEIQSNLPTTSWRYVPSSDNPADCASRGLRPRELSTHPLWWRGPLWLAQSYSQWPSQNFQNQTLPSKEAVQCEKISLVTSIKPNNDLLHRYSSLDKLLRTTVWCTRFIGKCTRAPNLPNTGISASDLDSALLLWVSIVQAEAFITDLPKLRAKQVCSKPLQRLSPFLDDLGLIRVGGRLHHANLPFDHKHPLLLPAYHHFTYLLIDQYHLRYLHPSPRTLQSILSKRFWILSARRLIRSRSSKCQTCFKCNPTSVTPIMGSLPSQRVSPAKPFEVTGVDYGGPFSITPHRGRGHKSVKAYLCLFVCFTTKAVHLELASDLTTQAFIAAFQRFIARRGLCTHIFSDSGTNFIGAKNYFSELQHFVSRDKYNVQMSSHFASFGIEWHLNPPSAPHFGGLWEAAIKSVKFHLARVVGLQVLTFEEFYTVLCKIESVLNSRPLCPLSSDPNDIGALTPNHFLNNSPSFCLPERDLTQEPVSLLTRWQLTQRIHQDFWKRWSDDYLCTLQQRNKWMTPSADVAIGTLVLLKDPLRPPLHWKLGRIIDVSPGADSVTRVARVKTTSGTYTRPLVKLCPLPSV